MAENISQAVNTRMLIGTDLLIAYLLSADYVEGLALLFRWIQRIEARKLIDMGSISILTHFVKTYELSRLRDFDVIKEMPKMDGTLRLMGANALSQGSNNRPLLMQLNLLEKGYADFLITENTWTHSLSRIRQTDDRVFTIEEFIEMCATEHRDLDETRGVVLKEVAFGSLSLNDRFFNTFKEEYAPYYYTWFKKKSEDSVFAATDEKGSLLALLKLKLEYEDEDYNDIKPVLPPARRLKISSFKVDYTGQKLGERFMRIVFDHAIQEHVDEIYVTIFADSPQRKRLISMVEKWGFSLWGKKAGGEEVYVRSLQKTITRTPAFCYPFQLRTANTYLLSIGMTFSDVLVPSAEVRSDHADYEPFRNAIRKTLVIDGNQASGIPPVGSTILFYRKGIKDGEIVASGVVDGVYNKFAKESDFLNRCKKRSILSPDALHDYWLRYMGHPVVIDFLNTYSFRPSEIGIDKLNGAGINAQRLINMNPIRLSQSQFDQLIHRTSYEKDIIVD